MKNNIPYWFCNKGTTSDNDDFINGESFEYVKEVSLIKLKDGRYQVSEMGVFRNIINGHEHTLVENKIVDILKKYISSQIEIIPITIFRRATNEKWINYSELIIKNQIDLKEYYNTNSNGVNIYIIKGVGIYVSNDLKNILKKELIDDSDIEYKIGLPLMA